MQQYIVFERLDKTIHDRNDFDCGEPMLNSFLREKANQYQSRSGSVTHVAVQLGAERPKTIFGYYTLVNNCISFENFPTKQVKGLPSKYPIPTTKIAMLARNKDYETYGFGENLLIDAIKKILKQSETSGIFAIDVDTINDGAKKFYLKYGFVELIDNNNSMVLPLESARKLLKSR